MNRPVRASYLIHGLDRQTVFTALLDVPSFTEWGYGLREARAVGPTIMSGTPGKEPEVVPGTTFEFVLSAAGLTHQVKSIVTRVESPHRLDWDYTTGAVGVGGWLLENEGGSVLMTLYTDYEVKPDWLNRLAHRPFFRGLTESLLRRSMKRFEDHVKDG